MEKQEIITALQNAEGFYLGGSRRMNELYPDKIKIHDNTDYDFYCAGNEGQLGALKMMGFELISANNRSYWDNLLVDIYIHKKYGIECLIRSDVVLYKKCFDSINVDDYLLRLWKSNPDNPPKDLAAFRAGCLAWFNYLFYSHNHDNLPF
jgi:hypothetical protein